MLIFRTGNKWIGWYFQFLGEKFLKNKIQIPGPKFGNVSFDGFKEIPWDFKAHVKYNDNERTFQKWHEDLKGGKSNYEIERIKRGAWSRLRKVEFSLKQISFIKIDDSVLIKCSSFQRDFRNADGTPRREKVLLDLEQLDEEIIFFLDFNSK